jgi:hypothetical protein
MPMLDYYETGGTQVCSECCLPRFHAELEWPDGPDGDPVCCDCIDYYMAERRGEVE